MSKNERDPNSASAWAMVMSVLEEESGREALAETISAPFDKDPVPEVDEIEAYLTEQTAKLSNWCQGRIWWALIRSEDFVPLFVERISEFEEKGEQALNKAQEELEENTPEYWQCMRFRAQLLRHSNPNVSIALFEQVRTAPEAAPSEQFTASNALALAMLELDPEGAIKLLEKTLSIPDVSEKQRGAGMLNLADMKFGQGDVVGATMLLGKLLEMEDLEWTTWAMTRIAFANRILIPNKKPKEAIRLLDTVVENEQVPGPYRDYAQKMKPLDPSTYVLFHPGGHTGRGNDTWSYPEDTEK